MWCDWGARILGDSYYSGRKRCPSPLMSVPFCLISRSSCRKGTLVICTPEPGQELKERLTHSKIAAEREEAFLKVLVTNICFC